MADEVLQPTFEAFTDRALGGYARPTPVLPSRTWGEAAKDTALDTAAGAVGVARGVAGAGDMVQTAISTRPPTEHPRMDALSDVEAGILNQRSANAKYIDESGGPSPTREPGRYAAHVATGVVPYLPFAALGPLGAVPAAAVAMGNEQAADREAMRSGNMDNNSQYLSLIQSGMTDQQARERMFQDVSDPRNPDTYLRRAPAVLGQAAGFGAGVVAAKGILRTVSGDITDKILAATTGGGARRAAMIGGATGAAAGVAMGSGAEFSRQASDVFTGQRQSVDYGPVAEAGLEPGALFGALGTVGHGVRRLKELAAKRNADSALVPPSGTDVLYAANAEAHADQPVPGAVGEAPRPPADVPDFRDRFRPDAPEQPEPIVPPDFRDRFRPGAEPPEYQPKSRPGEVYDQPADPWVPAGQPRPEVPPMQPQRAPAPAGQPRLPTDPWVPDRVPGAPSYEPLDRPPQWQPGEPQPEWAPPGIRQPAAPPEREVLAPAELAQPTSEPVGDWAPRGYEPLVTPTEPLPEQAAVPRRAQARADDGDLITGLQEKGSPRASQQEEGRPQAGPATEGVSRPQPEEGQRQTSRAEEGGPPPEVAKAEGGSTPAAVPPAAGAKGKAVLDKLRKPVEEKLADTSLAARLTPLQRVEAAKLKTKLAEKPDAPVHELAKEAVAEAHASPENYVDRTANALVAQRERKTAAEKERKQGTRRKLAEVREQTISEALSKPEHSLSHIDTGANRSAREVFEDIANSRGMTTLKDAQPDEIKGMANTMIRKAEERIKTALAAMQQVGRSGMTNASQIPWSMPKNRGKSWENNPWYSALYAMEGMKNNLQRLMPDARDKGPSADATMRQRKGLIGFVMTEMYVLDRAIEQGKIHLWDRYTKENARSEYEDLTARRAKLENQVRDMQAMSDRITAHEARLADTKKQDISDFERAQYEIDKKAYKPQSLLSRVNELEKHNQKIARAHEASGLDLYNQSEAVHADFENLLIEAMDQREKSALSFIREHLNKEEAELIQQAREGKRLNARESKTGETRAANDMVVGRSERSSGRVMQEVGQEEAPPRKGVSTDRPAKEDLAAVRAREERASKRVMEIEDEAERINTALDAIPDENAGKVAHVVDTLHTALGDEKLSRKRSEENAQFLRDYADERMKELEKERRELAEQANPALLNNDYSVGRVLDPSADLNAKGNLPAGAYVKPVSFFLKSGKTISGRETSIRPTDNALTNHVFDVANKIIGDTPVVGLTAEQMRLAAEHRLLPPGTPAFYDPKAGRIFISHDVGAPDSPAFRRTLGHEIVHPLTELALEHFPDIAGRIDAVRKTLVTEVLREGSDAGRLLKGREHGLVNTHEFLSEFFNDGGILQSALDTIEVKRPIRGTFYSALSRVKEYIAKSLQRLFLRETHKTALSDAMVHSLDLFRAAGEAFEGGSLPTKPKGTTARPMAAGERYLNDTESWMGRAANSAAHIWSRMNGRTGVALWGHDLSQMSRRAEPGMQAQTEGVRRALAHSFTSSKRIMDEAHTSEIAEKIGDAMNRNPQAWERFQEFYDRENQSQVSGSDPIGKGLNSWISPTSKAHAQFRAEHAELAKEWVALPKPYKDLRETLRKAYDERHNAIAQASLEQLVGVQGMAPDTVTGNTLAKFFRDKASITPAERATLEAKVPGFQYDADRQDRSADALAFRKKAAQINSIAHLRKIEGIWYPKFRKGEWVVEGEFDLGKHAKEGTALEGTRGVWDFPTEAARDKFVNTIAADPVLSKVKFRGLEEVKDDDGKVVAYRAKYNPLMLNFFERQQAAFEEHARLQQQYGDNIKMTHVEPRKDENGTYLNPVKADRALKAMMDSLHKSEGWADLDTASQNRLEREMNEAATRHIMSTSARATYLPRKYALGSRKDVMQDFLDYMVNTSYSLAELRHRDELKTAYKSMDKYVGDMKYAGSPGDEQGKFGILRRQIQSSLHRRADYRPDPILSPLWKKGLARVLQLSYLDKLVSPMNWVLNGTELLMSGGPMLAGVHGARAYAEIFRAMNDMGVTRYLDGFKDAATVYRSGVGGVPQLADNPGRFKASTAHLPDAADIHKMIDYLEEYAHLDRDSSMEVGRIFDPSASKLMRGVDWGDNITRQISANIDNVNRVALGMAALRMARADGRGGGMTLEKALAHAEKYVGKMAGNYAKYNEAEMFRHPALGPMMQFKRYAQRMTANWLGAAYNSFARDVAPEDRSIARRQLLYMGGTLMFMSGALGLPIEPIKGVINAFSPFTGFDSDDAENSFRQGAAGLLGKDLGYAISRGVPRAYFNLGIGTRLGLDSLWTQGAPGDKPDSWYASIGHLVGGAPLSYGVEAASGALRLAKAAGEAVKGNENEAWNDLRYGAQLLLPVKVVADVINSAANFYGGPTSRTRYGQPLGYQPTGFDTAMEAIGLRTGETQERGDMRRAISSARTDMNTERNGIYARYVHAGSPAEKRAVFEQAKAGFNGKWGPDNDITIGDLIKAERRFTKQIDTMQQRPEYAGLTLSRRERSLLPRFDAYAIQ